MSGRPLCELAIVFILGILGEYLMDPATVPSQWPVPVVFALLLLLLGGLYRQYLQPEKSAHPFRVAIPPLLLFFSLGFLTAHLGRPTLPAPDSLEPWFQRPESLFLAEVVEPVDYYPDKIRLSLRLLQGFAEGKSFPVQGGILLTLAAANSNSVEWACGDRLLARLTLKKLHSFNNPGGFDYVKDQAEQGYYARAFAADDRFLAKLPAESKYFATSLFRFPSGQLDRFRQKARNWLWRNLEGETASMYAALLLGYRHQMARDWQEHLNRAGVTHLVAISGLHLGMVSVALYWLVCCLIRSFFPSILQRVSDRHLALWPAILAAFLYAFISGLALPTWRAALMLLLVAAAVYAHRFPDPPSLLAAAAIIILVISPGSLRQIAFQLSFGAMIGIFAFYPRYRRLETRLWNLTAGWIRKLRKPLRPFTNALGLSLAVNVVVLPLIAHHFHGVSIAGLLANAILVPFVGFLVLPLGLLSLTLFAISEPLAMPVVQIGGWLLGLCQHAILWFSHSSWSFFWVGNVPLLWLAGFYAGLGLILVRWRWELKAAAIAALGIPFVMVIALAGHSPVSPGRHGLLMTALDVGQGSSTLLRFPDGKTMLVDGGGFYDNSFDVGRHVIAPYLWSSGIRKLDYVVLSHDHPDHRNGLHFILSHFEVGAYWQSGIDESADGFCSLEAIASQRGIPIRQPSAATGDQEIGGCRVRVLHPSRSYLETHWDRKNLNNSSLVLEIEYGKTLLILPGDIDQSVERDLFTDHQFAGQVLLVSPHHGSAGSNSPLLLDRLQPTAMVFSCGFDNWFGFPAPQVLNACRARRIPCYRTDLGGAIQASSDGNQWEVQEIARSR